MPKSSLSPPSLTGSNGVRTKEKDRTVVAEHNSQRFIKIYGEVWKHTLRLNFNNNTRKAMADISMCKNEVCELNDICYRFKAIPNEYGQAYADFHPTLSIKSGKMECEYFLTTKEETGD